ncbi:hypothetical protein B0H13DRAFT_1926938 [Mycena leptocephala]|nr:hypothetical protein B0H13DRAFT_1926938 [Mycena leptocephala]
MPTLQHSTPTNARLSLDLGTTIGALEISILVALFLSGMVTVQAWLYFQRYRRDPRALRCLVGFNWSLDFVHTIAICHTLYTITVTQYGHPELLLVPPLSLDTAIMMSGFIGPLEQGWFTFRLYKLTNAPVLPLFCTALAFARFVGIVGLSFIALHAYPITEYNARAGWLIETIVIISAVLDTILVLALCYHLSSWRLDKSRGMNKIVNQIMTWTMETGALTIIGALGLLITVSNKWKVEPDSSMPQVLDNEKQLLNAFTVVYVGFFVVLPKLFSNSLLLSLNARQRFAEDMRADRRSIRPASTGWPVGMTTLSFSPTTSRSVYFQDSSLGIRVEEPKFGGDELEKSQA